MRIIIPIMIAIWGLILCEGLNKITDRLEVIEYYMEMQSEKPVELLK